MRPKRVWRTGIILGEMVWEVSAEEKHWRMGGGAVEEICHGEHFLRFFSPYAFSGLCTHPQEPIIYCP